MKKILTRILSLCLVFSMLGCSSSTSKDDVTTFFDALDTTLDAKSGKLTGTLEYDTTADSKINFDLEIIQTGDMQVKAILGLEAGKNKIDDYIDFYIKDGKTYLQNNGTTSQSVASNIGIDTTKTLDVYNPFLDLSDDELASVFASSSKKGNDYTFEIDGEQLTTLLDGMGTLSISSATVKATVDDDHLSYLEFTIDGYQAYDDDSYDVYIHLTCNVDKYNSLKSIDFPENLEKF